ncbi:MAG: tetratricopeptide repeat protein [Symploca sp. SIO2D2]|nr:tetratricopeptide repeat protein [Symploca sp. SIO2D2]
MNNQRSQKRFYIILGIFTTLATIIINLLSSHIYNLLSSYIEKECKNFENCSLQEDTNNWLLLSFFIVLIILIYAVYEFLSSNTSTASSSIYKKKQALVRLRSGYSLPPPIDSEKFKGRNQDLEQLHQGLEQSQIFAILGMPGVGKSELAMQYAHHKKYQKSYAGIIWLSLAKENYLDSLRRVTKSIFASELELGDNLSARECWAEWSRFNKPILVIFDHCHDFEELKHNLPSQPYIKALITSSQPRPSSYVNNYHTLEALSETVAIELFKSHLEPKLAEQVNLEIQPVKDLCQELGYLPIALVAASSYIKNFGGFRHLQKLLQADAGKFLDQTTLLAWDIDDNSDQEIQNLLDKTLNIYDQLWHDLSAADKRLAYCLSFFAPGQIPSFLIDEFAEIFAHSINLDYPTSIKYGFQKLREKYLNYPTDRENQFSQNFSQKITIITLHPIVRSFFKRKRLEIVNQIENPERDFCYVMAKIAKALPQDANHSAIPLIQDLVVPQIEVAVTLIISHAPASATWFDGTDNDDEAVTLLDPFMGLVKFYRRKGEFRQAINWQEKSKDFLINIFGYRHPLYIRCLNNLACLYDEEEYYQRALYSATNNLGKNHQLTGLIHRNFGSFYYETKRDYQRAREQFEAAVGIYDSCATSSEDCYYQQIMSQLDLAQAQCRLGNFQAAGNSYLRVEQLKEEFPSSDRNKTHIIDAEIEYDLAEFYYLRAMSNYAIHEDFSRAAQHSRQALEIREEYQKEETPVAHSLIQLARIAKRQNKLREAEEYYARALPIYRADPQTSDTWHRANEEHNKLLSQHPQLYGRWLQKNLRLN